MQDGTQLTDDDFYALRRNLESRDITTIACSVVQILPLFNKIKELSLTEQLPSSLHPYALLNSYGMELEYATGNRASQLYLLEQKEALNLSLKEQKQSESFTHDGSDLRTCMDYSYLDLSYKNRERNGTREYDMVDWDVILSKESKGSDEFQKTFNSLEDTRGMSISRCKESDFPSRQPIQCNICDKVVRADNYKVHLRSHTGEKPYQCPKCPFRTANPSSMPKHMRLHDVHRTLYSCCHCPYNTIYKSNLYKHNKTQHADI